MSHFQESFTSTTMPVRVRFGAGLRKETGEEISRLGARRALILSTPQQTDMAQEIAAICGPLVVGCFAEATMHTPVAISERATDLARSLSADVIVAVGGGSTTGLGKAIALRTGLPQIVLPTTYAGSEATPILGQTENGLKTTLTDPEVLPEVILYDAELLTGLPMGITVTSALNAMAHAAEGLYARDRSPLTQLMAIEGLTAFRDGLPLVRRSPEDPRARGETLYGAWLCGTVLGQVGMALHHKLCHTLGGSFDLPHAETHAILLPHTIAYNAQAVPDLLAPVTRLFADYLPDGQPANAGVALYGFAQAMGAPLALRDLGLGQQDLARAVDIALTKPYWNPRPLEREALLALLQAAWEGRCPDTAPAPRPTAQAAG